MIMFKGGDRDKRVVVVENKNMNHIIINNNNKKNKRESGLDEFYFLSLNQEEVEEKSENHQLPNVPIFNLRAPPPPPSVVSSPVVNRVVSPSSSSSFSSYNGSLSNGFWSPDDGSLYSFGHPEEFGDRYQALPPSGYHPSGGVDLGNGDRRLVDELGLAQSFRGLSVGEEGQEKRKGFGVGPDGFLFGLGDSLCGVSGGGNGIDGYGCYGGSGLGNGGFEIGNSQVVSVGSGDGGVECRLNGFQGGGGFGIGVSASVGSYFGHDQASGLCSGSGWCNSQGGYLVDQRTDQGCNWGGSEGINSLNSCDSVSGPYINSGFVCSPQCSIEPNGGRGPVDFLGSHFLVQPRLDLNSYSSLSKFMMLKGKPRAITNSGDSRTLLLRKGSGDFKALSCEDNLIIQGNASNHVRNKGGDQLKAHRNVLFDGITKQNQRQSRVEFDGSSVHGGSIENGQSIGSYSSLPTIPSSDSLGQVQGYIYLMAHDQNGCRFLQKIFDEGTSKDVDVIFNELIDHTVELMLKPFGNYVIQKLLDVCNEEQRLQVVRAVTKEPGKLVGICLNTYGTRVAQKLIETLKTRQQITLVILALKPGFLDLIKDQNGNHVIQRCLQHLSNEDNRFIFDAAAKFCAEIATHQHGCCVMQRCIEHSTGKQRDKLIMEICKNGLFLAQDPYGNYVVQFVFDLKSPSVVANLPNVLSQFKGHYVHLSTQKFGSHVVEKCLNNFEESRSQIVRELLSVQPFDQLLQHEFANYVIQTALSVTKGPLHSSLVEAVRPHLNLRTSPYCKRIFSQNLFKK